MASYYKRHRHRFIISELKKQGQVSVAILAKTLMVAERTIRRDIHELAKAGRVRARYGGATVINHPEQALYLNNDTPLYRNMKTENNNSSVTPDEKSGKVFIIGSFNTDLVYRVKDFPAAGETIQTLSSCCLPGGKGSNQAIACAMANARTHFAVKLGDDEYAHKARLFLRGSPLAQLTCFEQPECATGSAVVMVSETTGDNAIIINPGANQTFTASEISACYGAIAESDVFLTQMENNPDATALALKYACDQGVITILNPAPWREEVNDLIPWARVITPNLTEAAAIAGMPLTDERAIRLAAEIIHARGARVVLITLGSAGCWLFDGKRHRRFKAFPVVNVDTSGAGDAFNGALAARLAEKQSLEAAIIYASAFAALAVEREGAANMPEHRAVMEKLTRM